jgi:hypothetical protein
MGNEDATDIPNDIHGIGDPDIWSQCFVNVVTETITYDKFFSEKIWKPIVGKRPFLLLGPPGSLLRLRRMGFKTFGDYWDESYNDVTYDGLPENLNEELSCKMIADILTRLDAMPLSELKKMYRDMKDILKHNHTVFFDWFSLCNNETLYTIVEEEK